MIPKLLRVEREGDYTTYWISVGQKHPIGVKIFGQQNSFTDAIASDFIFGQAILAETVEKLESEGTR